MALATSVTSTEGGGSGASACQSLLQEVELRTVAPLNRMLVRDPTAYVEERVELPDGHMVTVAKAGDTKKPCILTYHDLGLNYISNFQTFFNYPEVVLIRISYTIS